MECGWVVARAETSAGMSWARGVVGSLGFGMVSGAGGRAGMSAGMSWARGVEGSLGLGMVPLAGGSEGEGSCLWMRSGEGRRARFWLWVMEADEVVEKGESRGFRPR